MHKGGATVQAKAGAWLRKGDMMDDLSTNRTCCNITSHTRVSCHCLQGIDPSQQESPFSSNKNFQGHSLDSHIHYLPSRKWTPDQMAKPQLFLG